LAAQPGTCCTNRNAQAMCKYASNARLDFSHRMRRGRKYCSRATVDSTTQGGCSRCTDGLCCVRCSGGCGSGVVEGAASVDGLSRGCSQLRLRWTVRRPSRGQVEYSGAGKWFRGRGRLRCARGELGSRLWESHFGENGTVRGVGLRGSASWPEGFFLRDLRWHSACS